MMLDFYSHYAMMEKPTSIVEMLEGSNLNRSLRGATAMAKSKRTANPREVKKCSVLGCDEPHEAKELCRKHYQQIKRWGRLFSGIKEPNQIIHNGDTTYIILCDRQGLEKARAVIDSNDLQQVSQFKWHMHPASPPGPFYAVTSLGNNKYMKLHHLILGKKCETDHRDRNGLNNCRENLREAAPWQNSCNRVRSIKYSRTGYRGVYQCWSHGKLLDRYWAEIRANGKRTGLGRFITPEEAARAYDAAAIRLHGEYATLNFPQPSQGEQP